MIYFVTYYEEYPIYEPAEGGYYYAGRQALWSEPFDREMDAIVSALDAVREYSMEQVCENSKDVSRRLSMSENVVVGIERSKYIGEAKMVCVEYGEGICGRESGYRPYE